MPIRPLNPDNVRSVELGAAHEDHEHAHADLTGVTSDQHHAEAHTVASHSDTTATGAELETLTDGSDADALHTHGDIDSHTHVEADVTDLDHYTTTDANTDIDARVNKAFVDALNVDADTLDGMDSTDFAEDVHAHVELDITDLDHYTDTDANAAIDARVNAAFVNALDLDLDETDLDASVNASLDLADSSVQPGDDADTLGSGAATDGQVLTADGAGAAAWEDATGGSATDLDDLTDVDTSTTAPDDQDILVFNGTNWVPKGVDGYTGAAAYDNFMTDYRSVAGDPYHFGRIFEDFGSLTPTVFDREFDAAGGGGASVQSRSGGGFPNGPLGLMRCYTGTTTTGYGYIATPSRSVNLDFTNNRTDIAAPVNALLVRAQIQIPIVSDATNSFWLQCCLTNDATVDVATASDFIGFYYSHSSSSGVWIARTESSSSVTTTNTSVTVGTAPMTLEFLVQAGSVDYYIDGVHQTTITTNIPTADLQFQVGIAKREGTTGREAWVDWAEMIYYRVTVPGA